MWSEQKLMSASDNAFISLTTMLLDDEAAQLGNRSTQNPLITYEDPLEPYPTNGFRLHQNSPYRESYHPHLTIEAVNEALQKGHVFRAVFRVNAYHRVEAYCKIDGVLTDVLISGIADQNRAVEGDIVAIQVYPVSCWARMRGSAETSNTTSSEHNKSPYGSLEVVDKSYEGKNKVELITECVNNCKKNSAFPERVSNEIGTSTDSLESRGHDTSSLQYTYIQDYRDCSFSPDPSKVACDKNEIASFFINFLQINPFEEIKPWQPCVRIGKISS